MNQPKPQIRGNDVGFAFNAMPSKTSAMNAEQRRIEENNLQQQRWHLWGPYLSDRQWGTVREDYSANGDAWNYLSHDQARSRAYRWGEDGLGGISDYKQRLCFAWAFWNGQDPILKERLFGLTGPQGNHGEDVKELYWYLDNTPSHSYMRMLYRYPQARFPYEELISRNAAPNGARIRTLAHQCSGGAPLLRYRDRLCQKNPGRHFDSCNRDQPWTGAGDVAFSADVLVSQYLELGP